MAKIRAYKVAEEIGLDRNDLLKKAAEVGIELKSPMVGLDEEQAAELRKRLGGGAEVRREEKRVGSAVIRRRRAVAPKPVEEKESPPPVAKEVEPEPLVAEATEPLAAQAPEEQALAASPAAGEGGPAITEEAVERPAAQAPSRASRSEVIEPAQPPAKRIVRRQAIQGMQLREQDTLARMMRGNVQIQLERRRQIVEQQSRIQPRHRRPAIQAPPRKLASATRRKKVLKLEGPTSLQELSGRTSVKVQELIQRGEGLGLEVERTGLIDVETAALLATDVGFEVQTVVKEEAGPKLQSSDPADLEPRPPVVTVMGHVDHGKTSLLDAIRQTKVVAGEVGGITQHIGAYKVTARGQEITFIDTPGHEAFTQMRARGAGITDITVLVVAADDGIMPQTVEAISHAKAAQVPILVAINKIDRPDADTPRVKRGLLEHELVPEELGGDTICVEVSATQGTNIDKLLEMIVLQAEIMELKARRKGPAVGTVIEAQLDRGRGPLATVLVQEGTLTPGDAIVAGRAAGRVRALQNERGETVKEGGPSTPVQVIGLSSVPDAGDEIFCVESEREAKAIAEGRLEQERRAAGQSQALEMDPEALFGALGGSGEAEIRVVLKADVHGTMEAIREAMEKLSTEKAKLRVIHCGVGALTESDVMLAGASGAIPVGFHIRPELAARKAAEREGVEIRTYEIVYEVLEDMTKAMQGMLPPQITEHVVAHAEVRQLFPIPRVGTIAGCYVADGTIQRANPVRVVRDGVPVYKGRLSSLRRFKDDVREVQNGLECGMAVENFNDIKVGDTLESYVVEETPATL